jgi:hypothetical protein
VGAYFDNQRYAGGTVVFPFVSFSRSMGGLDEQNLETRFLSGARDLSHGDRRFRRIRDMAANKFFTGTHVGRYWVNVAGYCANYYCRACYLGQYAIPSGDIGPSGDG